MHLRFKVVALGGGRVGLSCMLGCCRVKARGSIGMPIMSSASQLYGRPVPGNRCISSQNKGFQCGSDGKSLNPIESSGFRCEVGVPTNFFASPRSWLISPLTGRQELAPGRHMRRAAAWSVQAKGLVRCH